MSSRRHLVWMAFQDGAKFRFGGSDTVVTMSSTDAGSILLPTGRIVAADPLLDPWQQPFTVHVPPGFYPVHFALAGGEVAVAMLLFNEGEPVVWKRAKPRYVSVDSATACMMDQKVTRFLRRKAELGKYETIVERFEDALARTGTYGLVSVSNALDANVLVFRTFGGDGTFPALFGYDAAGLPICLVIDMLIEPVGAEPVTGG